MVILGLSGAISHDPSAALYVDGKLVAAIEEERLLREKHAKGRMPLESQSLYFNRPVSNPTMSISSRCP